MRIKCYECGHEQELDVNEPNLVCDNCNESLISLPLWRHFVVCPYDIADLRQELISAENWVKRLRGKDKQKCMHA